MFVPAAVRQVEDFSPEWWQLVTTSTWFHDYWLSQQQGEDGFFGNTYTPDAYDSSDIADMLPDSIDTDEDILSMEAQYEQFLLSSEMETANAFSPNAYKQMPMNSKYGCTHLDNYHADNVTTFGSNWVTSNLCL